MNKKIVLVLISSILMFPLNIDAAKGCCSHHGGVSGCSSSERQICKDGTLSPSCTCTSVITYIYGREDKKTSNYYPNTDVNDGSYEFSTNDDLNIKEDNDNQENKEDGSILDIIMRIATISSGVYLYKKIRKTNFSYMKVNILIIKIKNKYKLLFISFCICALCSRRFR